MLQEGVVSGAKAPRGQGRGKEQCGASGLVKVAMPVVEAPPHPALLPCIYVLSEQVCGYYSVS